MSSPALDGSVFTGETVRETYPDTQTQNPGGGGADAALTARAVIAVTLLGAAFWYVLWKVALYFVAGR